MLTAYAILLGAEVNAQAEQLTAADTTRGRDHPRGDRDAVRADSPPGDQPDRDMLASDLGDAMNQLSTRANVTQRTAESHSVLDVVG